MDREFGDYLNHDLAQYHVASCADIESIEAHWIDEHDEHLNPMGSRGSARSGSSARQPRSPTRSSTPPAHASATSRSAWTACSPAERPRPAPPSESYGWP